ncbi:MAG: hypothetical protein G3M70_00860 [Candidatus Nitronauta litoralis]|uniref:Uncharacterized protein n=1 Tax=Candidatus Nitronauta litoralis TaxID=2705533 RepID=A0A7T0BTI1_9BACT|nr:MAG: hypothetical protein G3M70_00860 [Candidatus Nitronauta litoralis]
MTTMRTTSQTFHNGCSVFFGFCRQKDSTSNSLAVTSYAKTNRLEEHANSALEFLPVGDEKQERGQALGGGEAGWMGSTSISCTTIFRGISSGKIFSVPCISGITAATQILHETCCWQSEKSIEAIAVETPGRRRLPITTIAIKAKDRLIFENFCFIEFPILFSDYLCWKNNVKSDFLFPAGNASLWACLL